MSGTRRQFLSAALVGLARKSGRPVAGGFIDDGHEPGHQLRDRASFAPSKQTIRVPVVIAGGGIAGLSAAWRLEKRGFRDFVLLEMSGRAGGNARWGENEITPYPWAAHYVPVPGKKTTLVRELFEELGVLRDGVWEERYLCFSPQERLYLHGRWQEGIEPTAAATAQDRENFSRFFTRIKEFRATGEFTIPMKRGAKPSALDRLSIANWLKQERFTSPYLNWYVNYACRDDYGALAQDTSAWAGIHYFASREPEEKGPLTWPEGNGWIARRLIEKLNRYIRTGAMVHRIARDGRRLRVSAGDTDYLAEFVIFAAPSFLAPYICEDAPPSSGLVYSPWLTANLTLDRLPRERGIETAWDNVIYDSPALGYVVATHQSLHTFIDRTVWTFYWSLAQGSPADNRRLLLAKDWNYWTEAILNDLSRAHPDIRECVSRIDVLRLGHAMVRPVVGFLESEARRRLANASGNLLFANSDLSGFSIFEEAQYRGVKAAEQALKRIS
ncbi:MAG TPA: FAD-dependent oxidoreductase [Bryobacteraceae bacterium]|nr:FAD-dependent oxidoreductase [Bryobacteraceae bacterium]